MKYDFDLIVIGSGSGGSVGAHYARSRNKSVAIFESVAIGGECPNFACVPTKALLHAAKTYETVQNAKQYGVLVEKATLDYSKVKRWKDLVVSRTGAARGAASFEEDGMTVVMGKAKFTGPHTVEAGGKTYSAKHFLIAAGTDVFVPPIPGLDEAGYITFKHAVNFNHLPKSIFIIGGGPIGCEFAQIFSTFGSKVTMADAAPRLLVRDDSDVSRLVQALFENRGVDIYCEAKITAVERKGDKKVVHVEKGTKKEAIVVEEILVATGKRPSLNLDLEKAGIKYDNHGIKVNSYLQTSASHIYAAGDVVGPYQYTPTASYQSHIAAHNAFSYNKIRPNYDVVPRCVFTDPEVAGVGMSEDEIKEKKIAYKKGVAPIAIVGRANTENEMNGFVKVLTDKNEKIIGASIVGPRAGEMIHELALAMKLRAKASDIASMIHAFPTFSETIKIACSSLE